MPSIQRLRVFAVKIGVDLSGKSKRLGLQLVEPELQHRGRAYLFAQALVQLIGVVDPHVRQQAAHEVAVASADDALATAEATASPVHIYQLRPLAQGDKPKPAS
jgi:hypothetical protein